MGNLAVDRVTCTQVINPVSLSIVALAGAFRLWPTLRTGWPQLPRGGLDGCAQGGRRLEPRKPEHVTVKDSNDRVWELQALTWQQANNWGKMIEERTACVALGKRRGLW